MKLTLKFTLSLVLAIIAVATVSSCSDGKSYTEMLDEENKAVNRFLSNHRVVGHVPADSVFEIGENAPYYQIDDEGNVYMQVLNRGDGAKVKDNQLVYFRYMRANLVTYNPDGDNEWYGNATNMNESPASFKYNDYSYPSSTTWGAAIQMPLMFLNLNCEVNLVVKSAYGRTDEMSYVQPYLFKIRYFKSQI